MDLMLHSDALSVQCLQWRNVCVPVASRTLYIFDWPLKHGFWGESVFHSVHFLKSVLPDSVRSSKQFS